VGNAVVEFVLNTASDQQYDPYNSGRDCGDLVVSPHGSQFVNIKATIIPLPLPLTCIALPTILDHNQFMAPET
jgi:hypothetical protein